VQGPAALIRDQIRLVPARGLGDHCPVTGWKFSDAWFATAVAIQDRPCDLAGVIEAGDALDHSIFTHEEIQQAVRRLVGTGLLRVCDDGTFDLTPTGQELLGRRRGEWFHQIDSVLGLLRKVPVHEAAWSITEEAVRSAYLAYVQSGDPDTRGP
jgi:hypothetical protein